MNYFRHLEATELPHQTKCSYFMSIHEKLQLSVISGKKALSQTLPDNNESQETMKKIQNARAELQVKIKKIEENLKDIRKKYKNQWCQIS